MYRKKHLTEDILQSADPSGIMDLFIAHLRKDHNFSQEKIQQELSSRQQEIWIPSSIFSKKLGTLESVVKYLVENKKFPKREIAKMLGRDPKAVWSTYNKASKKLKQKIQAKKDDTFLFPASLINNRNLSVLESIVSYLRDANSLRLHDIAAILKRKDSTIWTIYRRAKTKKKDEKAS